MLLLMWRVNVGYEEGEDWVVGSMIIGYFWYVICFIFFVCIIYF